MELKDIRIERVDDRRIEIGATFHGEYFYYRIPEARFRREAVGDALLSATLAPAMMTGSTLTIPDEFPVSLALRPGIDAIQRIWQSWNPRLKRIPVEAASYEPRPSQGGVGLFYAGGVDSSFSLHTHFDEVELLICCFGFDFSFTEETMRASIDRNGRFARNLGKELIAVETNQSRFVRRLGMSRLFGYSATFASAAHLMGLKRCYIASSNSLAICAVQYGSHPVLDPLLSNGTTEVVHDEPVPRIEKTYEIARRPELLANLRVCWNEHGENCGECSKCLRTMAALRLFGIDGPFPPLKSIRKFRGMAAHTEFEYVIELVIAAQEMGDDALLRELKKGLRRNDFRAALQSLDRCLGGRLRSLYSRIAATEMHIIKPILRPDIEIRGRGQGRADFMTKMDRANVDHAQAAAD